MPPGGGGGGGGGGRGGDFMLCKAVLKTGLCELGISK